MPLQHHADFRVSTSGLADWGGVSSFFKKRDQRVCSSYRGITLLSLPGDVYAGGLEESLTSDSGGTMRVLFRL